MIRFGLGYVGGVLLAVVLCPALLQAQSTEGATGPAAAGPRVEVTPFVAMGSAFSSRVGASIAFAWTKNFSVEAEFGYRRNEIDALNASANLLYTLPRVGRVSPYLAAGMGMEQYGDTRELPVFGVVTQQKTGLAVNLGGGIKVPVNESWALRSDVRWLNTLGTAPEGWRVYNGVSLRVAGR